jgi:2,3-bisphosphoglycerate-independent phosphoglycerate mutase
MLPMDLEILKPLIKSAETKIVFLVIDGLGGLPRQSDNKTELEAAYTPNLDNLAKNGICGLQQPVGTGITPGSGPGHLGLFGYNPLQYKVGRGVLAAHGIGFELQPGDVAARGNFCTIDQQGNVTDRRAGRISTEKNQELCTILNTITLPDANIYIQTVKEHRFLLVLRANNLSGNIFDTDPQQTGVQPKQPQASTADAQHTVTLINEFLNQAKTKLANHHPANMVLLRGFSTKPDWPTIKQAFGLTGAAIAGYPMYRGVAKLIGMDVLETSDSIQDKITTLEKNWNTYDFFYLHIKKTDSAGEDGDFQQKVSVIEETDKEIPKLLALKPDVLIVTGDHSTPSTMKAHSWHPVPVLLSSPLCRPDNVQEFTERACLTGGLGNRLPAKELMLLALAHAQRLDKYGA